VRIHVGVDPHESERPASREPARDPLPGADCARMIAPEHYRQPVVRDKLPGHTGKLRGDGANREQWIGPGRGMERGDPVRVEPGLLKAGNKPSSAQRPRAICAARIAGPRAAGDTDDADGSLSGRETQLVDVYSCASASLARSCA
jgi:hypothetical protein